VSIPDKIFDLLAEDPRCAAELAEELGITIEHSRAALGWLRKRYPPDRWGRRMVFITDWKRSSIKGRFYLRAVYAIGLHKDEPSPGPLTVSEYNRRYRERTGGAVSSVFALGQRVTDRRAAFDWRAKKTPQHLTLPQHSVNLSFSAKAAQHDSQD